MFGFNPEKYRRDFPVLQKKMVYFDNACMSLKPVQVVDAMNEYYREFPACGARSMHSLGKKVDEKIDSARKQIQEFIGAKSQDEIIFTRNTTEALNIVASGMDKRKKILTSDKEHNSNLIPWQYHKFHHQVIPSHPDNTFNLEEFKRMISQNVGLVSLGFTSNLDGVSICAKEIIEIAHDHDSLVILDAAQTVPHHTLNVKKLDVDFLAFSGHKMCGPTGTGVLYGKREHLDDLDQFIVGGETVTNSWYDRFEKEAIPNCFEAGLQDYAGIIGLGACSKYLENVGLPAIERHEIALNTIMTQGIQDLGLTLIGPADPKLRGGICNFYAPGIDSHRIALLLDSSANVMVRSGMHCVHSWFNAHSLSGSVRASTYFYNTVEECHQFVETLKKVMAVLK